MYDLVVIGAGWAGYNAALRAKEIGLKVCLIEANQIGGTCLNYGCIPTKTLIQSAKIFSLVKKSAAFGIKLDNPRLDFVKIQDRKNKVIAQLAQGMQSMLKGIDFIKSTARVISAQEIEIQSSKIDTKFILIATGSQPVELPDLKFDHQKIISSNDALLLTEVPSSLLIIGGGVIGCEFASLFSALGSQVTVAEKMPLLLFGEDKEISRKIEAVFNKKGIKVVTSAKIADFNPNNYSCVLVCAGREPNIRGLVLGNLGLKLESNRIVVDDYLKTNIDSIYAAGDCVSSRMLAHYAAYQGVTAVNNMFSDDWRKADNLIVPSCIFTEPQISSVGLNEEIASARGIKIKIHRFDFRASAMAHVVDEAEGFIKVISNQETGQVLGACMAGPLASELIAIPTLAITAGLNIKQFQATIFAHPTFAESIHKAINS
ncbi:MAG: dihydrolipoyl dehydrogenase [Candidatus Omnitrophota bacterium]